EQNTVESGIQYTYVDNTNDNESTGRLPLIPDYRSNQISAFSVFKRKLNDVWQVDVGARFVLRDLEALTITDTIPRTIARKNHTFFNYNIATSLQYTFLNQKLIVDLGFAQRQPEVNELYSSGLHQGLASIEYGNPDLVAENSLKVVAALEGTLKSKTQYQILGYYQYINDYIFLEPTGEFELTISGSFPVFVYNQTNAQIFGVDALLSHYFSKQWQVVAQASYLKGDDLKEDIPLIYMPPNNAKLTLNYFFEDGKRSTNTKLGIRARFVAEQKHIQEDQDFLPPPPSYFLLGFDGSTQFQLRKNSLIVGLSIDNLLNTTYRDYLNRLRYFADDLGINVQLRLSYQF
ncbi:MAG: TonB-dependent receptor, partial [Schleiferiaceae bacterium]|nr:TonB-dependent receptor [Schleiferiaceae bacterium]